MQSKFTIAALTLAVLAGTVGYAAAQDYRYDRDGDRYYDRDDDRLIVRGIVRNPASAATLKGLTVVVLVSSKDGYTTSAQAPAAVGSLGAGAETPFVVTLPDADWIERFRVSFRIDGIVLPHVDRRGRNAIARTE